jgi:hypothetical protein
MFDYKIVNASPCQGTMTVQIEYPSSSTTTFSTTINNGSLCSSSSIPYLVDGTYYIQVGAICSVKKKNASTSVISDVPYTVIVKNSVKYISFSVNVHQIKIFKHEFTFTGVTDNQFCDVNISGFEDSIYDMQVGVYITKDNNNYTQFIKFTKIDNIYAANGNDNPTIVPLEGVEIGKNYAMLITTSCGLWRYLIGDTVSFTSKNPYKFVITGRTKYFINAFGEELIMDNAEKGLAYACKLTGAEISEYTAAPVYMDSNAKCRHQWLIEFAQEPADMNQFATILDKKLQELNSDYEAKRFHDVTLQHLEVIKARTGLFNDWLKSKGKLGGQHKIPRLSNSRKNLEELLELLGQV